MYGHLPLIDMRSRGTAPKIVFINDFHCQTAKEWSNPGQKYGQTWPADHATVCTAGDAISSLDLRFLVGLTVSISSESESRAKTLFAKAKWFGAKTVAATHVKGTLRVESGWTEIFRKEVANG